MCGLKSRVALLMIPCLVAFGFYVGMSLVPDLDQEQRTFVNTYFFVGKFARSELFRAGLYRPQPEDLGTATQGARAELAIPVDAALKKDLELLIEYSLDPKLGERTVEISVNGEKVAEWTLLRGKRRTAHTLRVPSGLWRPGAPLNMTITAKDAGPNAPASPQRPQPEVGMILHAVSVYQMS